MMSPTKIIENYELLEQCNKQALIGFWTVNLANQAVFWSDTTRMIHEVDDTYIPIIEEGINFFVEEDQPIITEAFQECYAKNKSYDLTLRIKTAKGNLKHVRAIGKSLLLDHEVIGVHGTFQDVSDLVKRENQFKEALQIASEQNYKLKSFNHITSHNLKSSAGNITSLLNLMKIEMPELEGNEFFENLFVSTKKLNDTLKELNQLLIEDSKIIENQKQINLHELTNEVFEDLRLLAESNNVHFYNKLPKDLTINTNASFVKSIFYNLISNAIKYRDESKPKPMLEISLANPEDKNNINLIFKDNGVGIDLERHSDRLFNAYTTFHTNKNIESRGLGLFMVKNQIETLQGRILIDSIVNQGTQFEIVLPRS